MAVIKTVRRSISLDRLVSSDSVNVRKAYNYDLETMIQQIINKGGITTSPTVEPIPDRKGYYMILRGNRRYRGCVALLERDGVSEELKEAISYLSCDVVDQPLTETERLQIILDQGENKGLTREEVVEAVWRLDGQMMSEKQIGELMYYQLAQYTKNLSKLAGYAALRDQAKRTKYLTTWFRGTLGQKILLANRMGAYVKEQFLLTTRAEDGTLPEGVTVEVNVSQERLAALNKAKSADMEAEGWTVEAGGERFNTLLHDFREIDAGRASKPKTERPSAKALVEYATNVYKSAPIRAILRVAAGESDYGAGLLQMDAAIYRWTLVSEILSNGVQKVIDPNVATLITALIGDGPAADVEASLEAFFAAEPDADPSGGVTSESGTTQAS